MLGKTAGGLLWMFRYLERSENLARLVDTGQRIALTRPDSAEGEWNSILQSAGCRGAYLQYHDDITGEQVVDWLLRGKENGSSVMNNIENARTNARLVRTGLTREVWEAVNECWMVLKQELARKVTTRELPRVLGQIRQRSAFVRGALHGTMLRNDVYDFSRLGTFIERADSTARMLDVKYYVLLPSASGVGSSLDSAQWEMILQSQSAEGAFRTVFGRQRRATDIAKFLILDNRLPRSLAFCYSKIADNLRYLEHDYGFRLPCHDIAETIGQELSLSTIEGIAENGLHEFLQEFLKRNGALGLQIERDYRFSA